MRSMTVSSVPLSLRHLADLEGITSALSYLLKPEGCFIAFIDLRDHFFKYPFEMLTFAEFDLEAWLNPTSHLNRLRLRDYQRIIDPKFTLNQLESFGNQSSGMVEDKDRILPEFLTGDDEQDAVTQAMVFAISNRPVLIAFSLVMFGHKCLSEIAARWIKSFPLLGEKTEWTSKPFVGKLDFP